MDSVESDALRPDTPLIPARMINEYVYCPRLAYLEWVQSEWEASADTVEGSFQHRRVDQEKGALPQADQWDQAESIHARSITLESETLGLVAKIDLVIGQDGTVQPVDYKRGKRPHVAHGAYDPERVQLCVQGLLLRERGYDCPSGLLYFVGSKEKVQVVFDEELIALTQASIKGLQSLAKSQTIPPALQDSPKCPRCSLVSICLPDEVNWLNRQAEQVRPMAVAQTEALPLYVQEHGASIRKKGETLEVWVEQEKRTTVRLLEVSQVAIFGNAHLSTPTIGALLERDIPITWLSYGGWFYGHAHGLGHKNAQLREAQYRASFQTETCLDLSRWLVAAKIQNARTLVRRNGARDTQLESILRDLKTYRQQALRAKTLASLLGVEGIAAQRYFQALPLCLKQSEKIAAGFQFKNRNRRPPQDPINALLSLAYTLLARSISVAVSSVGLDVYRGFYHQSRWGKPALALDLMEPFRPLIADSCVLTAINNGEVQPSDFISARTGIALNPAARKVFISLYERRLSQEVTHPLFGYRISYRRLLEVQSRLFGRFLQGELSEYPCFVTR